MVSYRLLDYNMAVSDETHAVYQPCGEQSPGGPRETASIRLWWGEMPGLPSSTVAMLSHRNASFWSLRATRWEEVCLPTLRTTDRFRPSPSVCRGGASVYGRGPVQPGPGPPRPQRLSGALSPSACSHKILHPNRDGPRGRSLLKVVST